MYNQSLNRLCLLFTYRPLTFASNINSLKKMPSLIADVLFDIGKQLIESGNSEAALRFALSGKEPLNAMTRVLASVATLKLYDGYFFVGWENKNYKFVCERNKSYSKFLMNQIGNGVVNLRIDCSNVEFYRAAIDKIIEKKKLISFSAGKKSCLPFLDQFLPNFTTTLKYVMIPSYKMTATFRDTLNLESLIVLDYGGNAVSEMCCKTEKLETRLPATGVTHMFPLCIDENNPHLSSIKQLICDCSWAMLSVDDFNDVIKNFSSLEVLQYNVTYFGSFTQPSYKAFVQNILYLMTQVNNDANEIPSKFVFTLKIKKTSKRFVDYQVRNLDFYKEICPGFECDESVNDYYCFSKNLQSADPTKSTILELRFFK